MTSKFKPSLWRHSPTTRVVTQTTFNEGLSQPESHMTLNCTSTDDSESVSSQDEYGLGDHDIDDLIRGFDLTQLDGVESSQSNTSESNFGEPMGSNDFSLPSSSVKDEDNPFVVKPTTKAYDPAGPISLSPSQFLQNIFTNKKLPYGAQFEISRLVSIGKLQYDDILFEDIITLAKKGTNREAAPLTAKVMLKHNNFEDDESDEKNSAFAKERATKCPWQELDREEEAFRKSPYGGLGFDENDEPLGWHGGQVLFHAKLHNTSRDSKSPTYKLTLEPAELSFSHSFARRFGSKNFLRLKLTKAVLNKSDGLLDYLRRPLILCGSVFRAFFAKNHNVFYVKTNEGTNGNTILSNAPVPGVMSFLEFINWHNPLDINSNQKMSKYASRFALGLSNSVPGIMVDASNIHIIDDIINPETKSNMTDGAGKTNRWTLKQLRNRIDWEDKPTAIQTRVYGTKGLLVEDIRNVDDFSYVELTLSQRKIEYPSLASGIHPDPAHRVIDILRSSHVRTPCRLSVETIINLSENGVPKTVFLDLLHRGLEELVDPLLEWDGPDAMRNLWCKMCRLGGVLSARRAREEPGLARVKGYAHSEHGPEEDNSEDEDDLFDTTEEEKASAWWRDEISGCPASLEETVMCMIDSGFTPQNCPSLRTKLKRVIETHVKNFIKAYKINVPMSASAFLIPDTLGVLEPGEIFFKHSRSEFQTSDGLGTDVLLGNVLVTRYPCKLPTDVQKWKAVDKLELHHLIDVVVLSTKGSRRAADFLSGGDYDGDKGLVIFQPEVVEAFKKPPLHYSKTPSNSFIVKYFKRDKEDVDSFSAQVASWDEAAKIYKLQEYLLGAVRDTSVVGKYSNFHGAATYTLGYKHPETIRLAHMFCLCLDGLKSGMAVKDEVLKEDSRAYQKRSPEWKETDEEQNQFYASGRNEKHLQRPIGLGEFIMDELYEQAKGEKAFWLARIESRFGAQDRWNADQDLVAPWDRAMKLSRKLATVEKSNWMKRELDEIAKHIQSVYDDHRISFSPKKASSSQSSLKSSVPFTELPIEARQDAIRKLSRKFVSFPPPGKFLMQDEEIARLRASYAYKYDYERQFIKSAGGTSFPWDVAMRELGAIKARATGGHKTVVGEFYDHFNMKHPRN